jgi:hypothetical protein
MPKRSTLRAVAPDEKKSAPPSKPKTLAEAIDSGDYLDILLAQRREIARAIPEEKGPAKAALHRQLSLISKEIEALTEAAEQEAAEDAEVADEAFDASAI